MNETKKRLLLVDTPSYYYRAFHALPEFRSPSGQPTGAILGVVNMLRKLKQDFPSDYIACVFDPPGKTFRDAIYPEYKATRQAMPEELSSQIGPLRETVAALGWPIVALVRRRYKCGRPTWWFGAAASMCGTAPRRRCCRPAGMTHRCAH